MNAPVPAEHLSPEIPQRASEAWLCSIPCCDMLRFRKFLRAGGAPVFILDAQSSKRVPIWRLLVRDETGRLWQATAGREVSARRLTSVRQVYQIARNAGVTVASVPVDLGEADT